MKENRHLPLLGVGPVITAFQILITVIGIIASYRGCFDAGKIELLNIPLKIIGLGLVLFGFYLNYSAKHKSKLFEMVTENRLITTGVYSVVRNPVYSAVFLACTGAVCISNNLILFYYTGYLLDLHDDISEIDRRKVAHRFIWSGICRLL